MIGLLIPSAFAENKMFDGIVVGDLDNINYFNITEDQWELSYENIYVNYNYDFAIRIPEKIASMNENTSFGVVQFFDPSGLSENWKGMMIVNYVQNSSSENQSLIKDYDSEYEEGISDCHDREMTDMLVEESVYHMTTSGLNDFIELQNSKQFSCEISIYDDGLKITSESLLSFTGNANKVNFKIYLVLYVLDTGDSYGVFYINYDKNYDDVIDDVRKSSERFIAGKFEGYDTDLNKQSYLPQLIPWSEMRHNPYCTDAAKEDGWSSIDGICTKKMDKTMKLGEKSYPSFNLMKDTENLVRINQKLIDPNGNIVSDNDVDSDGRLPLLIPKDGVIGEYERIITFFYDNKYVEKRLFVIQVEPRFANAETSSESSLCGEGTTYKDGQCVAEERGGGCLIATATFGSEMSPQVQFLREIRDNTVMNTQSGTAFMTGFNQFYYSFSPTVADYERENPVFKEMVKVTITPLLTSLTLLNYVDIDTEEEMLGYGIGIILLNIGMYFVVPAVLIISLKKKLQK